MIYPTGPSLSCFIVSSIFNKQERNWITNSLIYIGFQKTILDVILFSRLVRPRKMNFDRLNTKWWIYDELLSRNEFMMNIWCICIWWIYDDCYHGIWTPSWRHYLAEASFIDLNNTGSRIHNKILKSLPPSWYSRSSVLCGCKSKLLSSVFNFRKFP